MNETFGRTYNNYFVWRTLIEPFVLRLDWIMLTRLVRLGKCMGKMFY